MIDEGHLPAWITLFLGLYSFAASIGELREPGFWMRTVREIEASRGLRFLTGVFCLSIGALIYLANPWRPDDWLSVLIAVIGGWIIIEGMLLLSVGDWVLALARRLLAGAGFLWALIALVAGLALVAIGVIRV